MSLHTQFSGGNYAATPLPDDEYELAAFTNCTFVGADLSGRRFYECTFIDCDLSGAKLNRSALRDVSFTGCNLSGVRFDACDP